uniref:ABC transporter domain-containing protein n=1 Tax=Trichuris muris TaxID=70415 RepID=A0A5S6QGT1_TRIMR
MGRLSDVWRQFCVLVFKNVLQKLRKQRRFIFELAFAPLLLFGLLNLVNVNRAKDFPRCGFTPVSISSMDPLEKLSELFCLSKMSCSENVDYGLLRSLEDGRMLSLMEMREAFLMDNDLYNSFSTVIMEAGEILDQISKGIPSRVDFDGVSLSDLFILNSSTIDVLSKTLKMPGGFGVCLMNSVLKPNLFARIAKQIIMTNDFSIITLAQEIVCDRTHSLDEFLIFNCSNTVTTRMRRYLCYSIVGKDLEYLLTSQLNTVTFIDTVGKNFTGLHLTNDGLVRILRSYITIRNILKNSRARELFHQLFETISTATYSTAKPSKRFQRFTEAFFCGRKLLDQNVPSERAAGTSKGTVRSSAASSRSRPRNAKQFQEWEGMFASSNEDDKCAKVISQTGFDWAKMNRMIKFLRGKVFLTPDTPFLHLLLDKINRRLEALVAAKSNFGFWIEAFKLMLLPHGGATNNTVTNLRILLSNLNRSLEGLPDGEQVLLKLEAQKSASPSAKYVWDTLQSILECWQVNRFYVAELNSETRRRARTLDNLNLLLANVHFKWADGPTGWRYMKYEIDMSKEYGDEPTATRLRGAPFPSRNHSIYLEHMELREIIDYASMEFGTSDMQFEGRRVVAHPLPVERRSRSLFSTQGREVIISALFVFSFFAHNLGVYRQIGYERERRHREFLNCLGVSQFAYFAAWIAFCLLWELTSMWTVYFAFLYHEIFAYSKPACLAMPLFAYCTSLCSLYCLLATLLNGVRLSASCLLLLEIIFFLPWLICQSVAPSIAKCIKIISFVFPQSTMPWIVKEVLDLESKSGGLQWALFRFKNPHNEDACMLFHIVVLLVQAFVYFLLTLFFDSVLPDSHGLSKTWNFPVAVFAPGHTKSEDDPPAAGVAVKLTNIRTNRSGRFAKANVDDLNLEIREHNLVAILDPNGLVGSTLILVASGLLKPARGMVSCSRSGYETPSLVDPRSSVLFCPNYSIMFYDLSFQENAYIYSMLLDSCCERRNRIHRLDELLSRLEMKDKMKVHSQELSVGEQKALSVLIALQLDKPILVLDNAGSDACFKLRDNLWALLSDQARSKTIVLSTNCPDFVDRFADAVAVVDGSKVEFFQTVTAFRDWLQIGYHICFSGFVAAIPNDLAYITGSVSFHDLLDRWFHEKQLYKQTSTYIEFIVPRYSFDKMAAFCNYFEKRRSSIGCLKLEIYEVTTKEALRKGLPKSRSLKAARSNKSLCDEVEIDLLKTNQRFDTSYVKGKRPSFNAQFAAVCYRRRRLCRRELQLILFMVIYPLLSVGTVLHLLEGAKQKYEGEYPIEFGRTTILFRTSHASNFSYVQESAGGPTSPLLNDESYEVKTSSVSRSPGIGVSLKHADANIILSASVNRSRRHDSENSKATVATSQDMKQNSWGCTYTRSTDAKLKSMLQHEASWRHTLGLLFQRLNVSSSRLRQTGNKDVDNEQMKILPSYKISYSHVMPESMQDCLNDINNNFISATFQQHGRGHKLVWGMESTGARKHTITELTAWKIAGNDLCLAVVMCQALCFVCVCCCRTVMEDSVTRRNKLMFTSSLRPPVYWISNFVFDMVAYLSTLMLSMVALFALGLFVYNKSVALLFQFIILTLAFGVCMIALIYLSAKVLPSALIGGITALLFVLFTGPVPVGFMLSSEYWHFLNAQELLNLGHPSWQNDLSSGIERIALLTLPPYGFIMAVMELQVSARILREQDSFMTQLFKTPDLLGYAVVIMFTEAVLFLVIGLLGDLCGSRHLTWSRKESVSNEEMNDAPEEKASSLLEMQPPVETQRLCKICNYWDLKWKPSDEWPLSFKKKTLIDNVSFCLPRGACVGLYGHRSSGKTTLCQLLVAMQTATSGNVVFHSVGDDESTVSCIGYSPQEDQLDNDLTVQETLTFYSRLRCVQQRNCQKMTDYILRAFDLRQVMNRDVAFINNAEKKRLSLAVAFVGDPSIVILDEPAQHLSFQECRRVYQAIESFMDNSKTMLIASENTDFLRSVCHDLNVMNQGKLVEFGSLMNQEWKFGHAYIMEVKLLSQDEVPKLTELVKERMPYAETVIHAATTLVKIPVMSSDVSPILIMQLAELIQLSFKTDRIFIFQGTLNDILEES